MAGESEGATKNEHQTYLNHKRATRIIYPLLPQTKPNHICKHTLAGGNFILKGEHETCILLYIARYARPSPSRYMLAICASTHRRTGATRRRNARKALAQSALCRVDHANKHKTHKRTSVMEIKKGANIRITARRLPGSTRRTEWSMCARVLRLGGFERKKT